MVRMEALRSCSNWVLAMEFSWDQGTVEALPAGALWRTARRRATTDAGDELAPEHAASHRIELLDERLVAEFRRRDERAVERAVGADRARLVFAGKVLGKTGDQPLGLIGIGREHLDNVLHGHRIVVGMPAVVVGDHGDARVGDL